MLLVGVLDPFPTLGASGDVPHCTTAAEEFFFSAFEMLVPSCLRSPLAITPEREPIRLPSWQPEVPRELLTPPPYLIVNKPIEATSAAHPYLLQNKGLAHANSLSFF